MVKADLRTTPRIRFESFHLLKMAASAAAETFGLIENLGPWPNSPAVSLNLCVLSLNSRVGASWL